MRLKKAVESIYYDQIRDQVGFRGWCYDCDGNDYTLKVKVNGKEMPAKVERQKRDDLTATNVSALMTKTPGFSVTIPMNGEPFRKVEAWIVVDGQEEALIARTKGRIRKWIIKEPLIYNVDNNHYVGDTLHIQGWAATLTEARPEITIVGAGGEEASYNVSTVNRMDVVNAKGLSEVHGTCGFHIRFKMPETGNFFLCFDDGTNKVKLPINRTLVRLESFLTRTGVLKLRVYVRQHGIKATVKKAFVKLLKLDTTKYDTWYKKARYSKQQLEKQKTTTFSYQPKISFVVPLYQTPENYLKEMIESVQAQTYSNWQLCLADGSGEGKSVEHIVKPYCDTDPRIVYKDLKENKGIAGNTNEALAMADGDYIGLVDHDDLLPPEAAFTIVQELNEDPEIDVLYSDEDKIDMKGKKHFEPNFKPDFSIDMLTSVNYICHLFVMKKEILGKVGGFREEYNGAQDFDLIFRATEAANKIKHIPRILYHWRCHMGSTAANPESKLYAFEAGIRAINAHFERVGIPARAEHGDRYGMYHVIYDWKEEPLVTVLIPNKDHTEDLDIVIQSLLRVCTYKNLEILVVENNSTKPETWKYYEEIQKAEPKVRVVVYETTEGFNYSAINNFGASFAKGEYLLLMNNDMEVTSPELIQELLGYAMREDVGCVGAKLYYSDDTIQHAGVVVGLGGVAGHAFPGVAKGDAGYMGRDLYAQNYSAVTAACLMIKKSKFDEVGGLDTGLAVAFNDVDFCLRVMQAGYKNVYNPYATMYHYESKSRGYEDTPAKQARFAAEIEFFQHRWQDFLSKGDPYYNPNLTLDKNDFSLRNLYTK